MKLPWMTEREKFTAGAIIIWLLFALVLCFVYGTAQADSLFGYTWVQTSVPIKDSVYIEVDGKDIDAVCHAVAIPSAPDQYFTGCVQRVYGAQPAMCFIYGTWAKVDVPDWFWEHERHKHCELGLNHK